MSIQPLLEYVRRAPGDRASVIRLAEAALDGGREDEALSAVLEGARRAPRDPRLWQWVGLLHRGLDDREAAIEALSRAAELAPRDASIAHGRARTTMEAGRPAVALFEEARRLAPLDGTVLLGLAAARLGEGDAASAEALLDSLLTENPGWLPGHHDLSQLRWMMGDLDGFTASFERALEAAPGDVALWQAYLIALIHAERFEQAMSVIARARRRVGNAPFLDANEATIHSEVGRVAAADACFTRLSGIRDVTLAGRSIRHRMRTGRIELAAAEIETWLDTPEGGLIWPYAGTAWRLLGDPRWNWLEGDPALIGVIDLADQLPSLDRLAETLRGLHRSRHQHLDQSVRNGTQTDGALLSRIEPEIRQLRAAIVQAVADYVGRLPEQDPRHPTLRARRDRPARFAGSWSVRLKGAGYHANHFHSAGWLSSALYVALPDRNDDPADAGFLRLGEPQAELGLDCPPVRSVEPKPGRLVLFPSTMWHGTVPFSAGERLTVAFDVLQPT
ncbi:hypothetical protein HZF05_01260 [Sphingomonas sp. CGMCC 1.13654]|uniref:Tetratricopeptide repeat protein n=1 Tax=Sphingomonas chungangi TaxID=2683589 RepID=A0A838L2G3_9SPHN|nr:putative 2OG-Fe(II) oxygenase [Sphingomonas chungangi]MBA2932712.1 hypothetical protein [Sphingomonas chungangi]